VPALDQQNYITQITARLADDQRIRALLLSGSFGRGTADAYSDVDLLALIARDSQEAVMSGWRETLETIAPIVYFNRLPFAPVLNAITDAWLRCDLQVQPVTETRGLTQDRYKVLIDRDGIFTPPCPPLRRSCPPSRASSPASSANSSASSASSTSPTAAANTSLPPPAPA
jgi:predicted nucleotidyltransferase